MLTIKNAGEVEGRKSELAARRLKTSPKFQVPILNCEGWRLSARVGAIFCIVVTMVLTGCKPPGARALLAGKSLIERGEFAQAVERLKTATSLMNTNAQAWNYLGLAYHQSGDANDAVAAYKKALELDENLVEAHYNLGCLWLEQGRPDLAKGELTAYTLRRGDKSADGWIKLGEAQLALRDLVGAEKSLNEARQFEAQNPAALNDLGVVQIQRNHASEAVQYFYGALKSKPDYAPAILNLAIVSQMQGNRQYALERYRDYLGLKPRPANWDAVNATAQALEQELNGSRSTQSATVSRPPTPTEAATPRPAPVATRTVPPKLEQTPASNPRANASGGNGPVEVTQVAPEPVIRGAPEAGSAGAQQPASNPGGTAEHRGFFSRVNPVNLFRGSPKSNESGGAAAHPAGTPQTVAVTPEPKPVNYPRYHYRSPRKPAAGDREAAQKAFAEGEQARQGGNLAEAAAAYRRSTQADPSYFDAYYNLGVVSVQSGNVAQALSAYETALAIEPDSHNARFNFALALRQANYPLDAAREFEKLLEKNPDDANAHYALANLYAQQLREPAKAREHYEKVLALNPDFPQAAAVHNWLWSNAH